MSSLCVKVNLEALFKTLAAGSCDEQCPAVTGALNPLECDELFGQAAPEWTGHVQPLLGGIHVVPNQRRLRSEPYAEREEERSAALGEAEFDAGARTRESDGTVPMDSCVGARDDAVLNHDPHQFDSEAASEVVVAHARLSQGTGAAALTQGSHRRGRSEPLERLDEIPYLRPGQPVVAVAPAGFDQEQASLGELAEVAASRAGADSCIGREATGRQGSTIGESQQYPAPGRISHQGSDSGNVHVSAR
jgi:hypothetical protein